MKIEMGESLIYSWLRHIKKCQIVQLNWKVSDKWESNITDDLENLMKEIQNRFDKPFGNVKNLSQMIKFSEVDVIGFDFNNKNLYGVDVAFHTYGLRYSDNVKNVTKKILRTLLVMDLYFDDDYNEKVIFSTPKVNPKEYNSLMDRMDELQNFIDEYNLNTTIEIISNDEFENQILNPILSLSNDVADTSELFLRSYQLTQLFDKKPSIPKTTPSKKTSSDSEVKIGKFVQNTFERFFTEDSLSDSEIKNLMDSEYSKKTFNVSYPILTTTDLITEENKVRYYKKTYRGKYHLCNDWYDRNYDFFNKWLLTIDSN